jgi:glyoxylase-like metal-dependent hydrolase (beta-lactamase superfamily II)
MDVQEIGPGLWRWTAFHPEWKQVVGALYFEAQDAVVLIDPIVPRDEESRFWRALDRDVKRSRAPVHVLVTVYWHTRDARAVVERYGARVWAPSRARAAIERRAGTVTDVYRPGGPLPGGVEAFATARSSEVVFWLAAHKALVAGDTLLGDGKRGVRMCPESWLPEGKGHRELAAALRPLLDLPVQRVLVSHGDPVLRGGRAALARALGHEQSSSATAR